MKEKAKDIVINPTVIQWLLEDENPAVKYRTQTEILNISKESEEAKQTHQALLSSDFMKSAKALFDIGKDYADSHALSALTECGFTRQDADNALISEYPLPGQGIGILSNFSPLDIMLG